MRYQNLLNTGFSLCLLILFCSSFTFAQKSLNGKTRSVLGDVSLQKKGKTSWKPLRVGALIDEQDLIKTMEESQAVIGLPDGSSVSIEENSEVTLAGSFTENNDLKTTVEIKSGKLRFNAQKQRAGSSFEFKTGTATAAIRGTDGYIGNSSEGSFVSLRKGRMFFSDQDESSSIDGGQNFVRRHGKKGFSFSSSNAGTKNFVDSLFSALKDKNVSDDELLERMKRLDSLWNAKKSSQSDSVPCVFNTVYDTIYEPSLTISGICKSGYGLSLHGAPIQTGENGSFSQTFSWETGNEGEKNFEALCVKDHAEFACGQIRTYYKIPSIPESTKDTLILKTASPVSVCSPAALVIEGQFFTKDPQAKLTVTVGSEESQNLITTSGNGNFSYTVSISDQRKNWNVKTAEVKFQTASVNQITPIALDINKTCKEVNMNPPKIILDLSDSLNCKIHYSLQNVENDIVIFSYYADGVQKSETVFEKNVRKEVLKLIPGTRSYRFTAKDQASNEVQISKNIGCYPEPSFSIRFDGANKEKLKIPPPPPGYSSTVTKTLRFRIQRLPENDQRYLKKITVHRDGKLIRTFIGSEIDRLDFEIPFELRRDENTQFIVEVTPKKGPVKKAIKSFEVR